jgi:SAM-dependent methyltransferase
MHEEFQWTPDYWGSWRESDNPYRRLKSQRDRQLAQELLNPRTNDLILEIGCGYGWITESLLSRTIFRWVGVDISVDMIRALHERLAQYTPGGFVGDAYHLPFPDSTFDKVLCNGVLMHLRDDQAALAEMARVIRPGGYLVLSVNNVLSPLSLPVLLRNWRKKGFVQTFRLPTTYTKWLSTSGLKVRSLRGDGVFATTALRIGRFSFPPRFAFLPVRMLDKLALKYVPWLAYEIWLTAVRVEDPSAGEDLETR